MAILSHPSVISREEVQADIVLETGLPYAATHPMIHMVVGRGGKREEFPRCFQENVDLNFLGFRNPSFSIDTIWNPILEAVFVSFVWVNSCRKD